jgi:hypothetical protein
MNNYSPNMLKTFDECPQKFLLKYIQKISLPQCSEIFEKGKKIHALANYYLKGFDISKMEKTLSEEEKIAWELLKTNKYFKLNVINSEYNLLCKVGKYWVGGRLDAFMTDEKDYFILDYKTGKIPLNAEQDFQTIVYLLCTDKFLNKKGGYNSLKFVYIGLKNNIEKEILLTENLKNEYENKIILTCNKIDSAIKLNNYTKNEQKCLICEYNKLCK